MDSDLSIPGLLGKIQGLQATIAHLESELQAHPAPPAIPEEVRRTSDKALRIMALAFEIEDIKGTVEHHRAVVIGLDIVAARAWLESQPAATDKAVCPECGSTRTSHPILASNTHAACFDCDCIYPIQVLVISPPRKVKP